MPGEQHGADRAGMAGPGPGPPPAQRTCLNAPAGAPHREAAGHSRHMQVQGQGSNHQIMPHGYAHVSRLDVDFRA